MGLKAKNKINHESTADTRYSEHQPQHAPNPPLHPNPPPPTPPPLVASTTTTRPKTFFRKTMQTWATEQTDNTEVSASITERPEVGSIKTSITSRIYCLWLTPPSSLVPPVAGALVRTKAAWISVSVSYSLISTTAQKLQNLQIWALFAFAAGTSQTRRYKEKQRTECKMHNFTHSQAKFHYSFSSAL